MSGYTAELVEQLLPTVWDDTYAYGMSNPKAPDGSMPKAATAKNESGTLSAHIADMKTAWAKAPLTHKMRVATLLYYGIGWTMEEIAFHEESDKPAVQRRLKRSITLMVEHLGGKGSDGEDDE